MYYKYIVIKKQETKLNNIIPLRKSDTLVFLKRVYTITVFKVQIDIKHTHNTIC